MEYREFTGKTVEEAVTEASVMLGTTSDKIEYEVLEEGNSGLFGMFSKEAVIRARKKDTVEDTVSAFLKDVLAGMDVDADIQVETDDIEKLINVNIEGADTGDIIGKRGATLDALQYLASIVANRNTDEYYRLKLDTRDYRERREKTLENLAKNVASKVKKTRRKVVLDPMNPYERRVIHSYLQADVFVTTKSEGEEPNRKVVVYYKK